MAQKLKSTVRRLVTLPVELAAEVDHFKDVSGASSDSDALKVLIGWGLTRNDRPNDLFARCKKATEKGLSLGEIITSVVSDHPLVDRATLGSDSLDVYLKSSDIDDEHQTRFRYSRIKKAWSSEYTEDHGRSWHGLTYMRSEKVEGKDTVKRSRSPDDDFGGESPSATGRPSSRGRKAELDDDIPF